MTHTTEPSPVVHAIARREVWRGLLARLVRFVPFVLGVAAALLGLYLYNALNPPPQPLSPKEFNAAVAQVMASATPAPAYSAQVYRAIQPSLVLIQTDVAASGDSVSDSSDDGREDAHGLGSGVVISDKGEILTALHVVEGAQKIDVTFADGTESTAQIASSQPENDIAVLQPDKLPGILVPAVMGNPRAARVGDEAYAFGNPFGLYGSLSSGVISGFDRTFSGGDGDRSIEGLIQIDAAVNPGNSGGPLLNRYGQVIGIVVGVLNPTETKFFVGIGFAVPITTAAGGAGRGPQY